MKIGIKLPVIAILTTFAVTPAKAQTVQEILQFLIQKTKVLEAENARQQAQIDNLALLISKQASKFVFLTSTISDGNLGGIAGADDQCNALAASAGLPGIYKAWLSTSDGTSPATTFNQATGPYIRPDGEIVAFDWADLTDGSLETPINVDENGESLGTRSPWTGTWTDGTSYTSNCVPGVDCGHCGDWTDKDYPERALEGFNATTGPNWTANGTIHCDQQHGFYCFGQ